MATSKWSSGRTTISFLGLHRRAIKRKVVLTQGLAGMAGCRHVGGQVCGQRELKKLAKPRKTRYFLTLYFLRRKPQKRSRSLPWQNSREGWRREVFRKKFWGGVNLLGGWRVLELQRRHFAGVIKKPRPYLEPGV